MTTTETMTNLIAESVEGGRIVYAKWTAGLSDALRFECDDWLVFGDTVQYWGTCPEGHAWRVHLDASDK